MFALHLTNVTRQVNTLFAIAGYKLQQKHMYSANNRYDRIAPVSCHAEVVN